MAGMIHLDYHNPANGDFEPKMLQGDSDGRALVSLDGDSPVVTTQLGVLGPVAAATPQAPVDLVTLEASPLEVPSGTRYMVKAWLPDSPGDSVHLRVCEDEYQTIDLTNSSEWLTNGARAVIVGPCWLYGKVYDLAGAEGTPTANDKLLFIPF